MNAAQIDLAMSCMTGVSMKMTCVILLAVWAISSGADENGCLRPDGQSDARTMVVQAVRSAQENGGGTVRLADGEYHFYSSSATNMRFHVSNHDQPDVRPGVRRRNGEESACLAQAGGVGVLTQERGRAIICGENRKSIGKSRRRR